MTEDEVIVMTTPWNLRSKEDQDQSYRQGEDYDQKEQIFENAIQEDPNILKM
jgi:hypothetical protein